MCIKHAWEQVDLDMQERHVPSRYCCAQAMGRALLLDLERGRFASAPFLLCRRLCASAPPSAAAALGPASSSSAGGAELFALLTRRHLLCVAAAPNLASAPALRWSVALEDLFSLHRRGMHLRVNLKDTLRHTALTCA